MNIARREFLRLAAIGGAVAACAPAAAPVPDASSVVASKDKFLSPPTASPKRGGIFKGRGSPRVHLDTTITQVGLELGIVYSRLFEERADSYEDAGKSPGLVEKWETSSDGKTYKLQIRKGVRWHNLPPVNGREFTADDVAWNFGYYQKSSIRSSNFAAIDTWNVIDKYNITVTLKYPFSSFLDSISYQHVNMVPHEVFEKEGSFRLTAIGTGPFILDKWDKDVLTTVKRNPDYWETGSDGKPIPYVDGAEFYVFGDDAAALAAFRAGKLDAISAMLAESRDMKKSLPNLLYEDGFRANVNWLQMNMKVKPWDDVRVRQAASLAIDMKAILDSHWDGDAQASGLIPSSIKDYGWQPDEVFRRYPQDPAKAKSLLSAAGQNGLKVELSAYIGTADNAALQIIQGNLNAVGFNATIKQVPSLAVGQENVRNGNYQILFFTGSSSFDVDDWTYLFWHSKGGRNLQGYASAEMDRLAEAQRSAVNVEQRKQVINQIQELMVKDMVAAPTSHIARIHYALRPEVKNFKTFHWTLAMPHLKDAWLER